MRKFRHLILPALALVTLYLLFKTHVAFGYEEGYEALVRVGSSKCVKGQRGAFAEKDFEAGDVIEEAPMVEEKEPKDYKYGQMEQYLFDVGEGKHALAFGNCSFMNHSANNANVDIAPDLKRRVIVFKATKRIKKDEELFKNYADVWQPLNGEPIVSC